MRDEIIQKLHHQNNELVEWVKKIGSEKDKLEAENKELMDVVKECLKYLDNREAIFPDSPLHKNLKLLK